MYGTYPPQGYGAGYPYAPPYGYYPPIQPDPPGTGNATAAMIFWVLLLLRHIFTLIAILLVGTFFGIFSPTLGLSLAALAVLPLIGMIGCVLAIISDSQKKNHNLGTIGAVMALVGCFPGLLTFGVIGLSLGVIGLILHFLAKPAFTK